MAVFRNANILSIHGDQMSQPVNSKFREFWIEERQFVQDSHLATEFKYSTDIFNPNPPKQIHVIEYSAYENLKAELAEAREVIKCASKCVITCDTCNQILKAFLNKYEEPK